VKEFAMKLKRTRDRGTALLLATVVVLAISGLVAAMFAVTTFRSQKTFNSSQGEIAFRIAQSGIDATVYEMDYNAKNYSAASTLSSFTGKVNGGTYTVSITPPFDGNLTRATPAYLLKSVGSYGTITRNVPATRGIQAVVGPNAAGNLFKYGMFGALDIQDSGNVFIDSYKSTLGSYQSQATHVDAVHGHTYARTNGNIGTNGAISLSGGVSIYGNATPGPSSTVTSSGGAWVMGSTAPATADQTNAPPPYIPTVASSGAYKQTGGTQSLGPGDFHFDTLSMSGSSVLNLNGTVNLYIDGDFAQSGQAVIAMTAGSKVTIYQKSGSFALTGGGVINTDHIPSNFIIQSQTTGTIDLSGNSDFYGGVYAPLAPLKPSGGAATYGAFTVDSVQISGGATFHYDEDIGMVPGQQILYKVQEWNEYAP
jgi:hypothetical protein